MELSEAITKSIIDRVTLCLPLKDEIQGRLSVGSHHLIFCAATSGTEAQTPSKQLVSFADDINKDKPLNEFTILHRCVDLVVSEAAAGRARLTLKCKHFLEVGLLFTTVDDCNAVARSVEILASLNDLTLEYPFYYTCPFTVLENGWDSFTEDSEFSRIQFLTDMFRISCVNKDFAVCPTYPEKVLVPKCVSDDVIRSCASFRDGGRFPVLAFFHKQTNCSIIRCSQPLVGTANRRSMPDEQLVNAYLPSVARGFIIDTRTLNTAQAAKNKGGGFEQEMFYSRWKRVHKAIPKWQALQDCLGKLIEDTQATATGEVSVLVHGGEGLDSTLMVTSLAQVILDPDARTIRGFESIIEREWVCGGHPFRTRCSHSAYAKGRGPNTGEAPTFLLFLDCVWQLWRQFPESFEFCDNFLLDIFQHSYFSEFGSFVADSECDRQKFKVKENTVSLWSYINRPDVLNKYLNPFYEPNKAPVWPSVAPQSLVVWERVYMGWVQDWREQDAAAAAMRRQKQAEKDTMAQVARLRRQVREAERELQNGSVNEEILSPS